MSPISLDDGATIPRVPLPRRQECTATGTHNLRSSATADPLGYGTLALAEPPCIAQLGVRGRRPGV